MKQLRNHAPFCIIQNVLHTKKNEKFAKLSLKKCIHCLCRLPIKFSIFPFCSWTILNNYEQTFTIITKDLHAMCHEANIHQLVLTGVPPILFVSQDKVEGSEICWSTNPSRTAMSSFSTIILKITAHLTTHLKLNKTKLFHNIWKVYINHKYHKFLNRNPILLPYSSPST